jgi:topoisomerase IA-like protein
MQKLLATGKTDLLQFVSSRTRRPFAAFLIRQGDGKIGFEFQAKEGAKGRGGRGAHTGAALRVLGAHPKDKRPVELHAGRYGPYVKHGAVNATLPDKEGMDALTLEDAVALLAAKSGKSAGTGRGARSRKVTSAAIPKVAATKSAKVATATSPKVTATKSPKVIATKSPKAIRKKAAGKPRETKPLAKTAIRKRAV